MKPSRYVAYGMLALAFSTCHAQEARTKEVKIYGDMTGVVYLNETFHINEANGPVRIQNVKVRHVPKRTAERADYARNLYFQRLGRADERRLELLATKPLLITISAVGQEVVAAKFGIVVYDAFKEFLGSLTGVTMNRPKAGMQWSYNPTYLFMFEKFGVVGVYVRQARLKDGQVWNFDENFVTSEFSERLGEVTREQIVDYDS